MRTSLTPEKKNWNPVLWNLVFPGSALVLILLVEHYFFRNVMLAPTCNFALLAILALYMPSALMFFWVCMFMGSSLFVLMHPEFAIAGPYNIHTNEFIRSIGVLVGGAVTFFLSVKLRQLSRNHDHVLLLLRHIPVPFVLSDENGTVTFVNQHASELLKTTNAEAAGDSYFALLGDNSKKGEAIQSYLDLFNSARLKEGTSQFQPRDNPGVTLKGTLMPLQVGDRHLMMTIIEEMPAPEGEPALS